MDDTGPWAFYFGYSVTFFAWKITFQSENYFLAKV
jgi:hypothetical protein